MIMKMRYILPIALAPILFIPKIASASELYHQQSAQEQRIFDGVREGQITPDEFHHLEKREASVNAQRVEDLRKNGGFLTPYENQHLNHKLNKISHEIHKTRDSGWSY
ncbi:hypothetical protein SAMD00079811_76230 (plasmid) [Scytonema sp. HK-05]|uniref:hypothetical protein n=1 Tax=Scytonema sp. HK-05 TaxID=1137095 RepID=UPI0009374F19|nr:hypothetical protein [Scytonema sp. HK-05]OKH54457.1 hypothetical protein NIES2130_28340 [Scytonema sp. HK-05]BAY49994.1 hypothetical protein SAMD00079811_76230 [Scytonema sp. HK-05]